jgi:hypothetical protein
MAIFLVATIVVCVALVQLWRRLGARRFVVAMLWLAGTVGGIALAIRVTGCADAPERPELVRAGDRLRHPYGFELLAPPSTMTPDPELAHAIESGYSTCSAWRGAAGELVVCGLDVEVRSRADLEQDVAAIRRGIDRAADSLRPSVAIQTMGDTADPSTRGTRTLDRMAATFPQWIPEQITWTNERGDARMEALLVGATIRAKIVTAHAGLGVVWSISHGDALADVVASLARTN